MKRIQCRIATLLSAISLGTCQIPYASAAVTMSPTHHYVHAIATSPRPSRIKLLVRSKLIIHDTKHPGTLVTKVTDSHGLPIKAAVVRFSVMNKNYVRLKQASAITNARGIAYVSLIPGKRTGTTKVKAACGNLQQSATVSTVAPPSRLVASPSSATIVENTDTHVAFTVRALNSNGTPDAGIPIYINQILTSGSGPILTVRNKQWVTNSAGVATFDITDVGYATGIESIGALAGATGPQMEESTFKVITGVDSAKTIITSMPSTMTADEPYHVRVTVKDSQGHLISRLTDEAFHLEFPDAVAQETLMATDVQEVKTGQYMVSFVANDGSGTDGTFQYGEQSAQLVINDTLVGEKTINVVPDSPANYPSNGDTIALISPPHNLAVNSDGPVDRMEYIVKDKNGNPASGVQVWFSSSDTNKAWLDPLFTTVNGQSEPVLTTDKNGEIWADVYASGQTGAVQLSATIAGGTAVKSSVEVLPPLQTVQLSLYSTTLSTTDATPIQVTVTPIDSNGQPMPNYGLMVSTGSPGAAAPPFTVSNNVVYTDDTGHATLTVTPAITANSASSGELIVGNMNHEGTLTFTTESTSSSTSGSPGSTPPPTPNAWAAYEGAIGSNMTIAGNLVVASDNGTPRLLYAYDIATGKLVWSYPGQDASNTDNFTGRSIVAGDSSTIVVAEGNGLFALTQSTGAKVWSTVVGPIIATAMANGQVFVVTGDGTLYAIDETTGKTLWTKALGVSPTVLSTNGLQVAVGTSNGTVIAYDDSGKLDFQEVLSADGVTGLATCDSQWLVAQSDKLTCVSATGGINWLHNFGAPLAGGNVAVDGNTIYAANTDASLTTLDLSTGNVISSGTTAYAFAFTPVEASGKLYGSTSQGYFYVVDAATLQTIDVISKYYDTANEYLSVVSSPIIDGNLVLVQSHVSGYSGDAAIVAFSTR